MSKGLIQKKIKEKLPKNNKASIVKEVRERDNLQNLEKMKEPKEDREKKN
jgi:hypothetical protein